MGVVLAAGREGVEGVEESDVVDEISASTNKRYAVLAAEFERWCPGRASATPPMALFRCMAPKQSRNPSGA